MDPRNASTRLAARWMWRFRDSQIKESQTEESQTDEESRLGETVVFPNRQQTAADEFTKTFDVEYHPNMAIQNPTSTEAQGTAGSSGQRSGAETQRTGPDRCTNSH